MWVFSVHGFVSVVQHRNDPKLLVVRGRREEDVKAVANYAGVSVEYTPLADYPYRSYLTKERWAGWLAAMAETVDYTNFKQRLDDGGADFVQMEVAHEIWRVGRALERPRVKTDKAKPRKRGRRG